jgi:hypothetical protein
MKLLKVGLLPFTPRKYKFVSGQFDRYLTTQKRGIKKPLRYRGLRVGAYSPHLAE